MSALTNWHAWRALFERIRKRYWALGVDFPRSSMQGAAGTVSQVLSATQLVLAHDGDPWSDNWWIGQGWQFGPWWWRIYIDVSGGSFNDPSSLVDANIHGNTGNTVTVDDLNSWIGSGHITSLNDLLGKPFRIVSDSGDFGSVPVSRYPPWPGANVKTWHRGTVTEATASSLRDENADWQEDQWAGWDLLVFQPSMLRRVTISGNSIDTLNFSAQSWTAQTGEEYRIVPHGEKWNYRGIWRPTVWMDRYNVHWEQTRRVDGNIGGTLFPDLYVSVAKWDVQQGVYYENAWCLFTDVWGDADMPHEASPDRNYTPFIYWQIGSWQQAVINLIDGFVEQRDYDGWSKNIRNMTKAEGLLLAGFGETSTVGSPSGGGFLVSSATLKSPPAAPVYWAIINQATNTAEKAGAGSWMNGILYTHEGFSIDQNDVGKQIILGWGFPRYFERQFRYMFPKTCWFPHSDIDGHPVDPPGEDDQNGPRTGIWVTRPASTRNREVMPAFTEGYHAAWGSPARTANPFLPGADGAEPFSDGQLARLVGDQPNDPTIGGEEDQEWDQYYDAWTVMVGPDHEQPQGPAGIISGGDTRFLIDDTADWIENILIEHTGVATAGSTTSLTDSGKSTSHFWTHPDRGRWLHHWVEVNEQPDGSGAWHARPITSHSGTTIGFSALPFSAAGKAYRIREPKYELNRWQGRKVVITRNDGMKYERTVAYSYENILWFDSPLPQSVQAGWKYEVEEAVYGAVYLRSGGKWIKPTGTDQRTGREFPDDPKKIPPDTIRRYGLFMKGDYISDHLISDMDAVLNQLRWTKHETTRVLLAGDKPGIDNYCLGQEIGVILSSGERNSLIDDQHARMEQAWANAPTTIEWYDPDHFMGDGYRVAIADGNQVNEYLEPVFWNIEGWIESNKSIQYQNGEFHTATWNFYGNPTKRAKFVCRGKTTVSNMLSCQVDFLGYATIDDLDSEPSDITEVDQYSYSTRFIYGFDSLNSGFQWRSWGILNTAIPDQNGVVISDIIGNWSSPGFASVPEPQQNGVQNGYSTVRVLKRYYMQQLIAIAKWSM